MVVTKIIYTNKATIDNKDGFMATCDIVLDDSIKLSYIKLFKKMSCDDDSYYLVFPSRQDIYKDIKLMNKEIGIVLPKNKREYFVKDISRQYEEFYHPVKKSFYDMLLKVILKGYMQCTIDSKAGECVYIPKD